MPVLTTTYPLINSTFNVSQHTLRLIQEKMSDAAVTCDQILNENKPWQELFKVCSVRIKAELLQEGILFRTQFPSLGIFILKKMDFEKTKAT